jgi:hypothetical protein
MRGGLDDVGHRLDDLLGSGREGDVAAELEHVLRERADISLGRAGLPSESVAFTAHTKSIGGIAAVDDTRIGEDICPLSRRERITVTPFSPSFPP